jgi:hypothetical protein
MEYENELRGFLDRGLKLKQLPSKTAKKIIALQYVSEKFVPDREYEESEVNEIIKNIITFDDHTLVRRELADAKLLNRSKDGRKYWMSSGAEDNCLG